MIEFVWERAMVLDVQVMRVGGYLTEARLWYWRERQWER